MSRSAPIGLGIDYWAIWVFLEEENTATGSAAVETKEPHGVG